MVLCHDITQIVPGQMKGPVFRRGHIVSADDIETLLDVGKASLYVYDPRDGYVHEDDAAQRIAWAAAGQGIILSQPTEGKVTLSAARSGLLRIDVPGLNRLNTLEEVAFATIHTHQVVTAGQILGGTRVIPLVVLEDLVCLAEGIGRQHLPLIEVAPLKAARVGIVTTGSEVFHGRIKDGFGPVLRRKFDDLGCTLEEQVFVSDQVDLTVAAVMSLRRHGYDLICVTGGMSVDPDDQTPAAIRETGARIVTYGAPTFPGAMFMLAYLDDTPIVGLPGCVMYHRASIFDLVIPRLLAGETVTRKDIVRLGHGGLCAGCPECRYPICSFGKGF